MRAKSVASEDIWFDGVSDCAGSGDGGMNRIEALLLYAPELKKLNFTSTPLLWPIRVALVRVRIFRILETYCRLLEALQELFKAYFRLP